MILCDREVELAMDQGRVVILPRPDRALMDSMTVDLRLGKSLDRWTFSTPDPAVQAGVARLQLRRLREAVYYVDRHCRK
jgi:deoxycytidine triphosphate deaminase